MSSKLLINNLFHPNLLDLSRKLFLLLAFAIPLSVELNITTFNISVPSEILIGIECILLLFVLFPFRDKLKPLLNNGISRFYMLYLIWMMVTIPFSGSPIVSLKYFIITAAHFWCFFVGGYFLLVNFGEKFFFQSWFSYLLSFLIIIIYSWYNHSMYDFRMDASVLTARPFYFDHALYSVAMSLLLPVTIYYTLQSSIHKQKNRFSIGLIISMVLALGIFLSFSRATWLAFTLSTIVGFTLFMLLKPPIVIKKRGLVVFLFFLLFLIPGTLLIKNNDSESKNENIKSHILSSLNMSKDVSNLERINRYKSSLRMFKERPLTGFGAGTFQESFIPYQKPEEMTRISVTKDAHHSPGRGGSTHSEYLRALSELGLPGFIFWLGIIVTSLWACLQNIKRARQTCLNFFILVSILSYYVHGLVNNFYQNEKVSFLVCMLLSLIIWRAESVSIIKNRQRIE